MIKPSLSVVFDYTSFLGVSSQQKWTFTDAFHFFSSAGEEHEHNQTDLYKLENRLWDKALNVLSSRKSDECNLLALIEIARSEGVAELKLLMPYDLDPEQLLSIREHSKSLINDSEHDEIMITL